MSQITIVMRDGSFGSKHIQGGEYRPVGATSLDDAIRIRAEGFSELDNSDLHGAMVAVRSLITAAYETTDSGERRGLI